MSSKPLSITECMHVCIQQLILIFGQQTPWEYGEIAKETKSPLVRILPFLGVCLHLELSCSVCTWIAEGVLGALYVLIKKIDLPVICGFSRQNRVNQQWKKGQTM